MSEAGRPWVFVVDDEPIISFTLATILEAAGYTARSFSDPLEALGAAETNCPDYLISDVDSRYKGGSAFPLRVRLQHVNNIDCSCGAFSARWRGLGIFAVAPLTRLPDKHVWVLFEPFTGCLEEIGSELDTVIHCSSFIEGALHVKEKPIEYERKIVSRVKREMDQPRLTESVRNGFSAPGSTDCGEACY